MTKEKRAPRELNVAELDAVNGGTIAATANSAVLYIHNKIYPPGRSPMDLPYWF
jgi:hypothetical protein